MLAIKRRRTEPLKTSRWLSRLSYRLGTYKNRRRRASILAAFDQMYANSTPYFHQIHVETCSFCNSDCHFCPASTTVDPRPKRFMSWEVIHALTTQLRSLRFNGLISLFNNNDPLIDRRLASIVAHFKSEIPTAKTEIYTNGILLNLDRAIELWDAGLDSLVVDHYYETDQPNKKIERFIKEFNDSPYRDTHDVWVNEIFKGAIRSSRGGQAPNKSIARASGFCAYPFMQFNVNYKGDVHLCCNDAYYKQIFGNVTQEHIHDIWNSEKYQEVRKRLLNEDRSLDPCKNCDAHTHFPRSNEIVHQLENNQILIPENVTNGPNFKAIEPANTYAIEG